MVDNAENILVEFDYQNISVIDPNKVIDQDGNPKERLIKQENLVMYANLECQVLPRTKLAIGVPLTETVRTISVGSINFLNPGQKTFLDNGWTDEITGKNSLKGEGVNQPKININANPNKSDDFYYSQTLVSNGNPGAVDNGLLGITQININYGTDFLPVIDITLEDVKGRALFEGGNNSPYAAFFQLPYPLFYLTIKGYLGKAVRLPLMLQSFTSSFDPSSGNFRVQLRLYGYKYTIMSHINWGSMIATPLMYQSNVKTLETSKTGNGVNNSIVKNSRSSIGLSKMKELYSEYKSKGLIDDNFPEITIQQLKVRLNTFLKNIIDSYSKTNLNVLNDIEDYATKITEYEGNVFLYAGESWAKTYLDFEKVFITNNGLTIYQYKKEYDTAEKRNLALTKLSGYVKKYNNSLTGNKTLGNGTPNSIPVDIFLDINKNTSTFYSNVNINDIDIKKTYLQNNKKEIPLSEIESYKNQLMLEFVLSPRFYFEGEGSFFDKTKIITENYLTKKQKIEEGLTNDLSNKVKSSVKDGGIGFEPTIRNVLAVFFAQGESFLRLLDDVHTKAWNLRDDSLRKQAVLNTSSTVKSVDLKDLTIDETPIYPWPQVIVENNLKEDGEKYELMYPGHSSIASKVRAFSPEIWPEVQFVEEFIKAKIQRENPNEPITETTNLLKKPNRLSFNAIEYPINNEVFQNVEEVKFFYEIYERLIINSFYSKLSRDSGKLFNMSQYYAESEVLDIIKSLGTDNPFLTKKLKEYNINSGVYLSFLRHISNDGNGELWQNYIRGNFNTSYIKNDVNNSFQILNGDITNNEISQPNVSLEKNDMVVEYFGEKNIVETYDITDIYPITNLGWIKQYMSNANGTQNVESIFKTTEVLNYDLTTRSITNYKNSGKDIEPITNFNYKKNNNGISVFDQTIDLSNLKTFYQNRTIQEQYITEGNLSYFNYDNNLVSEQTTSMLNSPYFVNAIQQGVYNFRYKSNELYPYKNAAFLFLNSLPLSTLREKYKEFNGDGSSNELDYLISVFKKYGAIHKLPYAWVLKYGSIWHRYKTWVESGVDILDDVWKNFNYSYNFDPANSAITKNYKLIINNSPCDMILQDNIIDGGYTKTYINTGFYPKTIDDFNVFLQGERVFNTLVQINGTCKISGTTLEILTINSNDLFEGITLSGNGISIGTTIKNQISGTSGGIGTYEIEPSQNITIPTQFIVTNPNINGYTNIEIQNVLGDKLFLNNVIQTNIVEGNGFDSSNNNRSLLVKPWSCYSKSSDGENIFPLPSFGSMVNQTKDECFDSSGSLTTEVSNNTSMYNGSVKLFWKAPHYGYFDNDKLIKSSPDSYLKEVFNNVAIQQNFSINGDVTKYSTISELFTTFDKGILDMFETEFLNFSRSMYDFKTTIPSTFDEELESQDNYKNFQMLMKVLLKIPKPTSDPTNDNDIVNEIQESQITNFKNYLSQFMDYKVVLKYGNPSNFDRRLFYSFSHQYIQDPYEYNGYNQSSPNSLPSIGGSVTLLQSKTQYPETWKVLETYVGFSEIPELVYSDNGSYITDFFIDLNVEFSELNIKNFAPIIKIYATQKLNNPNLNISSFYDLMDGYITKNVTHINTVLDLEMTRLRNTLPNVEIKQEDYNVKSNLEGEQTKYELWELFKTINDTWISGTDFKSKTIFEDVLLVDRASRDIGQKIYVDIFKLKDLIEYSEEKNSLLDIVQTILVQNNFVNFTLPAYANFYNVKDVSKNPSPKPEGTLEFANTLFGTHLNVDYRETSSKFLCLYANKPSEHLAINDNVDYRFRDDAFDLRRATDNPLLENQDNKTNWDKSNKVVGFNIDIGPQNQQIFKQFDISQDPGLPTTESLEVLNSMANLDRNRAGYSQSVSLYNLYKNRSYKCSVDMLGNALIQPMMYFNLRNVPMFSGPYMILKVSHKISENGFDTTFEGQRQPFYSIPKIDNFIQSLNIKILETIKEKVQQNDKKIDESSENILKQKTTIIDNVNSGIGVLTANQNCSDKLNTSYKSFTNETAKKTSLKFKEAYKLIIDNVNPLNINENLKNILIEFIFGVMYINSGKETGFETYNSNYGSVRLNVNYGGALTYFNTTYFCSTQGSVENIPMVMFETDKDFIDFFINKFKNKTSYIEQDYISNGNNIIKSFTKAFILKWPIDKDENVYNKMTESDVKKIEDKFKKSQEILKSIIG
jgi:hypothetical protein